MNEVKVGLKTSENIKNNSSFEKKCKCMKSKKCEWECQNI